MEITKEFINQLLYIVNLDADSKIRSKSGYGKFSIIEYNGSKNGRQVCMELWYKPTKMDIGMDKILLRKCYDLTLDHLQVFQSQFYQEVVRYLTGHPDSHKLIQYGISK
jgi:hypothetical protein